MRWKQEATLRSLLSAAVKHLTGGANPSVGAQLSRIEKTCWKFHIVDKYMIFKVSLEGVMLCSLWSLESSQRHNQWVSQRSFTCMIYIEQLPGWVLPWGSISYPTSFNDGWYCSSIEPNVKLLSLAHIWKEVIKHHSAQVQITIHGNLQEADCCTLEQVSWCRHLLLEGWSTAGGKSACYQHMVERPQRVQWRTQPYNMTPTIPYHTLPYYTILYHTIPNHTIWHHTRAIFGGQTLPGCRVVVSFDAPSQWSHLPTDHCAGWLNHLDGQNQNRFSPPDIATAEALFFRTMPRTCWKNY